MVYVNTRRIDRPGKMGRAVIAWLALNVALFVPFGVTVYFLGPMMDRWYVMLPILIAFIISEAIIATNKIAGIVADWINQREDVPEGQQPSWEKPKVVVNND